MSFLRRADAVVTLIMSFGWPLIGLIVLHSWIRNEPLPYFVVVPLVAVCAEQGWRCATGFIAAREAARRRTAHDSSARP